MSRGGIIMSPGIMTPLLLAFTISSFGRFAPGEGKKKGGGEQKRKKIPGEDRRTLSLWQETAGKGVVVTTPTSFSTAPKILLA